MEFRCFGIVRFFDSEHTFCATYSNQFHQYGFLLFHSASDTNIPDRVLFDDFGSCKYSTYLNNKIRKTLATGVNYTLPSLFQLVSPIAKSNNDDYRHLILYNFQIWRLVTSFCYFGSLGFSFLFNIIFTYRHCQILEDGSFRDRTADFVYMFLFGGVFMVILYHTLSNALRFRSSVLALCICSSLDTLWRWCSCMCGVDAIHLSEWTSLESCRLTLRIFHGSCCFSRYCWETTQSLTFSVSSSSHSS